MKSAAKPDDVAASAAPEAEGLRSLDRLRESTIAKATGGLSPESLLLAWTDWAIHLAGAPGKRIDLALRAGEAAAATLQDAWGVAAGTPGAAPDDPRFRDPSWLHEPFRTWARAFLRVEDWWQQATRDVPGTEPHHESVVAFFARQWLDMLAPSNLPWTNPQVIQRTVDRGGMNLVDGVRHVVEDLVGGALGRPADGRQAYAVGRDVAATPGRVVLRNRLIELIRYEPATPTVAAEPVLLVPAWIMKYYILDLSPHNSLVRWLVGQGYTVYCISWRNVDEHDRECSMDDYRRLGVMAALDAIGAQAPGCRVHAAGYCLGGTLLSIAAAAMAGAGDDRLASVTLMAAQTDFTEPGELQLFIDAAQLHTIDSLMWRRGFLSADQMSGAFRMLQTNDLVWSRLVHDVLMGERAPMSDLMAWNADSTRMPYRMHTEYLHRLFLNNDLAAGRYRVDERPVALQNLRVPIFAVGTERDHVAPWRSVYKIHYLADTEVTFVLTSGGHNAGIVSEPGHPARHYRQATRAAEASCIGADEWLDATPPQPGSWWTAWHAWLTLHSSAERVPPPPWPDAATLPAPGSYVLQP